MKYSPEGRFFVSKQNFVILCLNKIIGRMSYLLYAKKQEGLIWHTNCVLTRKNVRIF